MGKYEVGWIEEELELAWLQRKNETEERFVMNEDEKLKMVILGIDVFEEKGKG